MNDLQKRIDELFDHIDDIKGRVAAGELNTDIASDWMKKDRASIYKLMPGLFPEYKDC